MMDRLVSWAIVAFLLAFVISAASSAWSTRHADPGRVAPVSRQ